MKIEIKNISIKSLILSAFPLLVFMMCLVSYTMEVLGSGDLSIWDSILAIILGALMQTLVVSVILVVSAYVYNLLCSFGIKGIAFTLEEPETKEEVKEEKTEEVK